MLFGSCYLYHFVPVSRELKKNKVYQGLRPTQKILNSSIYIYKIYKWVFQKESTHAIFISVGFGMLKKGNNNHVILHVNNDYSYDESIATHSWSLRHTLIFFRPVLS